MIRFINRRFFSTQLTTAALPDLEKFGLKHKNVLRNPSIPKLYADALAEVPADYHTRPASVTDTGALLVYSGQKMGRVPKDKRIVREPSSEKDIWWGSVNMPLEVDSFRQNETLAINYINNKQTLYVIDGYAGWDPKYRVKVRVCCVRPYHALFMKQMLIRPSPEEIERDFKNGSDFYIFNAGEFPALKQVKGVGSTSSINVNIAEKKIVILGSQYAGEMKKGVFGVMHYLAPKQGVLSLHASANEGPNGDVTLLFGLSGTGKTTLSADPHRRLIGDDEHVWTEDGVFNIEGGCYAKAIGLTKEREPEIFDAIKFGALLENCFYHPGTNTINYNDTTLTENTRVTYPLEHIPNVKIPAIGGHPKNILFLTCDAWGVLPPVAKLSYEQAMYHFISGYTAKVAGTEVGVKDPEATFSACFGAAFLAMHPNVYAELLGKKMQRYGATAWLINTGWTGGKFGVGKRMSLKHTRAIIDAIHDGTLNKVQYKPMPVFGVQLPTSCPNVPSEILDPKNTWSDKVRTDAIYKTKRMLGCL
jgi:phosphoenolpyruvate carboxykinase (ATP)